MKRVLLLAFTLVALSTAAQDSVKVWTLKEVVDHAVSNNLTVKRSAYSVRTGEINSLQSKAAMLPTLNGQGSYNYNWGRNVDPTTYQYVEQRIGSINASLTSSLLLWNGFRLFYSMKQSEAELDALNEDLIKSRNDVILNVITLYLGVVFNKELYSNAQYQLNSTNEQLARTRKLAEAGSVPRANVLQLEAQSATNELNLIQRENALNLSILQLKQALQLPASTGMDVQIPQIDLDGQLVLNKTSDEIYEIAAMSMPEIKAARIRQKSAAFAVKSARGSYFPRFNLNANLSTSYSDLRDTRRFVPNGSTITQNGVPTGLYVQGTGTPILQDITVPGGSYENGYSIRDQFKDNMGKGLGISVTVPIFNGLSTRSAVQRAAVNREIANIALLENENRLRQSVETAYNDAVAASKTYTASEKQEKANDEAFRATKQRYDNGAANFVEYQTSENDLFRAKSDFLRAKYDFIFKKKILDFYQGLPLEF